MGLYTVSCPACNKAHMWFSANLDQRCMECQRPRQWWINSANIAVPRYSDAETSPDCTAAIEKTAYDFQCKETEKIAKSFTDSMKYYQELAIHLESQVAIEKAEVARLLAKLKRGKRRG